jgi:peptidoglycan/xylan/chitin deacetylase (PgdA/CDA1 family)
MKIPITMSHGTDQIPGQNNRLTQEHFAKLIAIAHELGFQSIGYDDLAAWLWAGGSLPERPVMFDFDHPMKSMRHEVMPVLDNYGYAANLFINTGMLDDMYRKGVPSFDQRHHLLWEEAGELAEAGWQIGAHTVTHPNLSELNQEDPTGEKLRAELAQCDAAIEKNLGITPQDFAFTGTSWSSSAEREVKQRYRFGRLWILDAEYQVDGERTRYADLVGAPGLDEPDGGPPHAARYITRESDPYRLPSMEINALIFETAAFRNYLEGALAEWVV